MASLRKAIANDALDMIQVITTWEDVRSRVERAIRTEDCITPIGANRLLAPIPRPARNVFCVGLNYLDHIKEGTMEDKSQAPSYPVFFSKQPNTVVGPGATVEHSLPISSELDWEVELAVVVGQGGRNIEPSEAMHHVFGYTIANDLSVRDVQARPGGQWFKGKNFDTHCPIGPWIVTADEMADPQRVELVLTVNGVEKQRANTRQMLFAVADILAELSKGMRLEPGDIVLTGTPSGVGFARKPPEFLRVGDVVEAGIEGIGTLRNVIVAVRE